MNNVRLSVIATLGAIALSVGALGGCGNGGASEPLQTSYDPAATSRLQFAVGVATLSSDGGQKVVYGLNEVETLRQKNGLSGVLYDVPMLIGPTNFDVLNSTQTGQQVLGAGNDLGTNHITWGTLNNGDWTQGSRGIKVPTSGAFGYGLCTCNSDAGPINGFSPLYETYNMPIYGNNTELWYGGPPAFPAAGPSIRALGWVGYSLGFTDFAVQPVIGTYHLYAAVPPAFDTPQNPTPSPNPNGTPTPPPGILAAGAQLTSLKALPAFATPAFTADHHGGGTIAVSVPVSVREAMVVVRARGGSGKGICVQSHEQDAFYTVVTKHAGKQNLELPDDLGPLTQSGEKTPTICPEQSYQMYAVGADYPAYEASYPNNLSQLPNISGANGQADITTSDILNGQYP